MTEKISHIATVYKVMTLTDHGIRITLDLPENAIMQAAMYMECKRVGVVLNVECTPMDQNEEQPGSTDAKKGRDNKKSLRGS